MRARVVALLCVLCVSTGALLARAQSYEWERTQKLLEGEQLDLHTSPEGKRIAWVRVVRDDVFVEDEIWPTWFNWLHWTTRDEVVRNELLFEPGGAYEEARVEETMRNLRSMGIFALVRIVPVRTADPKAVGVVVHTRDLWSLRLESDFSITTQIDSLLLRGTERNLFGRNTVVGGEFVLVPKTYTLREFTYARRLFGAPVNLSQSVGLIFNRESGNSEGSSWALSGGKPFYNLSQRLGFSLDIGYSSRVARQIQQGQVLRYQPAASGPSAARVWRQKNRSAGLGGYLRRGERYKQTFGLGWDYRDAQADPIDETMLPPELRAGFVRDVLPKQRTENGPFASYDIWLARWATFVNLGTFGQSENVRVGPSASLSARAPLSVFGSTTHSWVLGSSVGFVLAPGGGLVEARAGASTRYERRMLVDQLLTATMRGATPLFGPFRLVARASLEARRNDTSRSLVSLGASNGLRGYTSQQFFDYGASRVLGNVELRTLPLEWEALHVGGVLFYDVGSVYRSVRDMQLHYAAGVGLRILFPQFNRYPFSFDGGMSNDPDFRFVPTFTSGQVVPVTALEDG